MAETRCRHFNGYKPCGKSRSCDSNCSFRELVQQRILVVHLEAMGAVLRATCLLPAIKRKFPYSHITWVTKQPSDQFFIHNPLVDRVIPLSQEGMLQLGALKFDVGFCIDKSLTAAGIIASTQVEQVYGFGVNEQGAIIPLSDAAYELWSLGLDNDLKFFGNQKPETQLMAEALELEMFERDGYQIFLTDEELRLTNDRRSLWSLHNQSLSKRSLSHQPPSKQSFSKPIIVGINTGCSPTIPYKKLTVQGHRQLIRQLQKLGEIQIVLLGGPEDSQRNADIAAGLRVIQSETKAGLRDGLVSVQACDIIISGDSLGMHMAIALKKWVVAWFGPTCAHEIDLYDRGVKVLSKAKCQPCWRRTCHNTPMCYDLVDNQEILHGVQKGLEWLTSSFKQPSSEISS